PGATTEVVDDYIARREAARDAGQPLPMFPVSTGVSGFTRVASIKSEARIDDGTVFAREAVAILRPAPRKAVTYLAWRQPPVPLTDHAPGKPSPESSRRCWSPQPPPTPPVPRPPARASPISGAGDEARSCACCR